MYSTTYTVKVLKFQNLSQVIASNDKDKYTDDAFHYIRVIDGYAYATTGHYAVRVPVEVTPDQGSHILWIHPDVWKKAVTKANCRKGATPKIMVNDEESSYLGFTIKTDLSNPNRLQDRTYVDLPWLFKSKPQHKIFRLGLDAEYLHKIADALGNNQVYITVNVRDPKDINTAILTVHVSDRHDGEAILMPCRLIDNEKEEE